MKIGARTVQVGPVNTVQWVYVLLDRFLLHYWHVIHWTHARRDEDVLPGEIEAGQTWTDQYLGKRRTESLRRVFSQQHR